MSLVDSFRVLFKWCTKSNGSPKTKVAVVDMQQAQSMQDDHVYRENREQTVKHNPQPLSQKKENKQPINPHKSADAQAVSTLNKHKRSSGMKGSRIGRRKTLQAILEQKKVARTSTANLNRKSTLERHLFSPATNTNVNIRPVDNDKTSTHAFKPRNYQLALQSAKNNTKKESVLHEFLSENDNAALVDHILGIEPEHVEMDNYVDQNETDEEIELRNLTSLLTLREKSEIYILDQKLNHDRLASRLHAALITEVVDEICSEILYNELNAQMPEKIYEQLVRELSTEVVDDEKEFFPMTHKDERIAQNILSRNLDSQEIVSQGYNIDMTRDKLLCLRPGQWLNDEVINFYLSLCSTRGEHNKTGPKVHYHSTLFYAKLMQRNTYAYANVKRWTRKIDLFASDKVVVPIHLGVHWTCAVINLRDRQFEYYDSMNGYARGKQVLKDLQRYIEDESMDKRKIQLDTSEWPFIIPDSDVLPQQENSHDCGVFTCKFANFVGQDKEISFSQKHMSYFRNRMALEIANKRVL
jgi:hypothetical protein